MEQDTEEIKKKFLALKTRQDVANILGIKEKSLRYFLYAIKPDNMYAGFDIKKKSGGERHINAPNDKLKNIQRKLHIYLIVCIRLSLLHMGLFLKKI